MDTILYVEWFTACGEHGRNNSLQLHISSVSVHKTTSWNGNLI